MIEEMLKLAGKIALSAPDRDTKNFLLGAVGVRKDGTKVYGRNGAVFSTTINYYQLIPNSHAEGRVLGKMGRGGVIYVARVLKLNNQFAMSMPCPVCAMRIKAANIEKVYFTIDATHYGIWLVGANKLEEHTIRKY